MSYSHDEAYRQYYDNIRKRVKGTESKVNTENNYGEYIYPNTSNVRTYGYRRQGYKTKDYTKKNFKYIDGLIVRIIISLILSLGMFTLKTLPNKEAQNLYNLCKTTINTEYNYKELLDNMKKYGFDYEEIKESVVEKYNSLKENADNTNDIN
ncbi:MAG: peptidase M23 [Clostridium sp.]|nr:peptidase M23 [Clostridium sp.]